MQVFWQAHRAFAIVRSTASSGRPSMEMTVVIVEKLYVVLGMVSSGCHSPIPLDTKNAKKTAVPFNFPVFPVEYGLEASPCFPFDFPVS